MRDENIKKEYYWIVEAKGNKGIVFRKEYNHHVSALKKFNDLFLKSGSVSIQQKYKVKN